jgi:hypothetical protein
MKTIMCPSCAWKGCRNRPWPEFISGDGIVQGARLERRPADGEKTAPELVGESPWAPGTKRIEGHDGLMNNWDPKNLNNTIYDARGLNTHYVVSDGRRLAGRAILSGAQKTI